MTSDTAVWHKIAEFTPDDPDADFQFSDRLARENGWTKVFALGGIEEYKRFVYLTQVSTAPVTPSDIVDQIWHLHLTFTKSYWSDLCGTVLGRPLHHGPTKGGPVEENRFRDQYAATLALYRSEFGIEPPEAYWPPEHIRFSGAADQRWVDQRTQWVIAKPRWLRLLTAVCNGLLVVVGVASLAVFLSNELICTALKERFGDRYDVETLKKIIFFASSGGISVAVLGLNDLNGSKNGESKNGNNSVDGGCCGGGGGGCG
jgi:hypothetical protein